MKRWYSARCSAGGRLAAVLIPLLFAFGLSVGAATATAADSLYWANRVTDTIRFDDLDPGNPQAPQNLVGATLGPGFDDPCGVAIDPAAGRIYWANFDLGTIRSAKLDGSDAQTLATGQGGPCGVAIEPAADRIYWSTVGGGTIRFADVDPLTLDAPQDLASLAATLIGVAIDRAADRIYWANFSAGKIQFADLDPVTLDAPQDLVTGESLSGPHGVAIDPAAGRIYWANFGAGTIRFADLDPMTADAPQDLATGEGGPTGVAIDPAAGNIYWANFSAGEVKVDDLDPLTPEALVQILADGADEGAFGPNYPALLRTPVCGDGVIDGPRILPMPSGTETCDDGTPPANGDGCSASCTIEPGWSCTGAPSVCTPICGDTLVVGSEQCDDGNTMNGDCCSATCQYEGFGSPCDDGLFCNGTDTCSATDVCLHTGDPCPGPDGDGNCAESCDETFDNCTAPDPNGSACNDGTFCNGADTCSAGMCSVHAGNPCTGHNVGPSCNDSCNETADNCTGNDVNGTPCALDGNFCTVDQCSAGTCTHAPISGCGSTTTTGASTTVTTTSAPGTTTTTLPACATTPATGCQAAATLKGSLLLKDTTPDDKDQLKWKWGSSTPVATADLGNPTTASDYLLCVYANGTLALGALAPRDGTCAGKPCWKSTATGFKYGDKEGTPDGLSKLGLKSGSTGKLLVGGKGGNLGVPTLPLATPVRVQLRRSDGSPCWESTITTPLVNDAGRFQGKSD